jgi:hypothetical protein
MMELMRTPPGRLPAPRVTLGVVLLLVAGCAAETPAPRPADFSRHTRDYWGELHWELARGDGRATARGVVDVKEPDRITALIVELTATDTTGQIVGRALGQARPRSFSGTDPWPFEVRLGTSGREDRFALRIRDVVWKVTRAN